MKITISCAGRFHSYYMADQFNKRNNLEKLITTLPVFEVTKYGIPKHKIKSFVAYEVLFRSWAKFARFTHLNDAYGIPFLNELYDRWAASVVNPQSDVFIGWSSKSERAIVKAKANGMLTILERCSSHIQTQTEILTEEYHRLGKPNFRLFTHQDVIDKELREYELADFISVPSSFARRSFLERGFHADKIILNAYGVNLMDFRPAEKKDDVFRIVYVGQMSIRKGVQYLLKAFQELNLKNAELTLVGPMTADIKPLIEKAGPNVKYFSSQPQSELKQFYQQGSVFVICSLEEGMAMVQAQAMSCGLPLVCTTNTGGDDLITDGVEGFVIPIRDVESIKSKIEWLYSHSEERIEMGRLARIRVSQGFTWEDHAARYTAFLEQQLSSRHNQVQALSNA